MVFQCRSCGLSIKNGNLNNHLKWKCVDADLWCLECCEKFPGTEYLKHTSCVTKNKSINRREEFRKLVLEIVRNAKIKKTLKGQIQTLVKKKNIPTTKIKIEKFVNQEALFDFEAGLLKDLAKQMFLTAAEKMPIEHGNVLMDNWHAECKMEMVKTAKASEMSFEHREELKRMLRSVSQPKVWCKFQKFIDVPTRFSSPEVKDLAWQVYLQAKDRFPAKPVNLEVGTQWQKLVWEMLEASDANSEDKEALFKILRQKNMPKSREDCEKFLNNPIRFQTRELRELAQQVYSKAAENMIIKKKKKKIIGTSGRNKKGKMDDRLPMKFISIKVKKSGSVQHKYPINRNAKMDTHTKYAQRYPSADTTPARNHKKIMFMESKGSSKVVEPVSKKSRNANHIFF